jgi:hypothetical protein
MIVFDLTCAPAGHVFEAWFGSTADYEAQRARGLVSCPICGTDDVTKAVMAPRLTAKDNSRDPAPPPAVAAAPADPAQAARMKAMLHTLADMQTKMLDGSDYVGARFCDEARAIHLGESEARAIHGQATPQQAHALLEEGIDVTPLPFPVRAPGADN